MTRRHVLWVALTAAIALALTAVPARPAQAAQWSVVGESPATGHGVFRFPQALTYTPGASAVFVADQYSGVVQRFGRDGTWQADIGWFADQREVGRVGTIGGLATDRTGHLYVLDSENDRVQVFATADGRWLASFGSTGTDPGRFDLGENTGAGGIAIDQPTPDSTATVFIADQRNHRVQRFELTQTTTGGDRVLPPGPSTADVVALPQPTAVWGRFGDCTATACTDPAAREVLNYPQGIAVDPVTRDVLVADDRNHRVVEYTPSGGYVRQVGSFGTGDGQFRFPYDVGVDAHAPRQLYVADNNNHRVQAFDLGALGFVRGWGGFGAAPGQLEYTRALGAVADDPGGGVGVADTANNRVQVFVPDGTLTAAWGIAGRGPGYVTSPRAAAFDGAGRIHVADTLDHRVERLEADGTYLGQTGYVSANSLFTAPAAGDGQFDTPSGIAQQHGGAGTIFVADTVNDRVQELTPGGAFVRAWGGFVRPRGVAAAPDGSMVVADTDGNRLQRFDPATSAWSVVALPGGTTLNRPAAVAVAQDGALLVADTGNDRVLRIAGGAATTVPGAYTRPAGVAAGPGGDVYVSDTGASRIVRVAGGTTPSVVASEGPAAGQVVAPSGLAVDLAGTQLLVADTGNDRLQRLMLSGAAVPATARVTVGVVGGTWSAGDGSTGGRGTVTSAPEGIACPSDCRQSFTPGSTVTLTASAVAGAAFAGWEGACAGAGATCTLAAADGVRPVARFVPASQTVAPATPPPARPTPPISGPKPKPRDRTAPRLTRLRLTPTRLRPTRAGGLVTRRTLRGGALLRLTLSERARVTFSVRGRRGGTVRLSLPRGTSRVRVTGRLGGKRLRRGSYRLVLRAVDAAGNATRRTLRFRVR